MPPGPSMPLAITRGLPPGLAAASAARPASESVKKRRPRRSTPTDSRALWPSLRTRTSGASGQLASAAAGPRRAGMPPARSRRTPSVPGSIDHPRRQRHAIILHRVDSQSVGSGHVQKHQNAPQLRSARDRRGGRTPRHCSTCARSAARPSPHRPTRRAFDAAVEEVVAATHRLLDGLTTARRPRTARKRPRRRRAARRSATRPRPPEHRCRAGSLPGPARRYSRRGPRSPRRTSR